MIGSERSTNVYNQGWALPVQERTTHSLQPTTEQIYNTHKCLPNGWAHPCTTRTRSQPNRVSSGWVGAQRTLHLHFDHTLNCLTNACCLARLDGRIHICDYGSSATFALFYVHLLSLVRRLAKMIDDPNERSTVWIYTRSNVGILLSSDLQNAIILS